MTLNQSALLELTDVLRTADGGKVMRLMLSAMLQQTREAEARNNLSQDGDAVYTHVQDAGERATQVLASRQECQEGR